MTVDTIISNESIADSLPDRIRLDRQYDVQRLRSEVDTIVSSLLQKFYVYYMPVPLVSDVESPPTHAWADEPMLEDCPYLQEIFAGFKTEITSIRLMRLESGAELQEHCDPTLDASHQEVVRLTLPIFSDADSVFLLNGSEVAMQPGELWYMKLSGPHSVQNNSPNERINMSIDVKWNDWVENWLAANAN